MTLLGVIYLANTLEEIKEQHLTNYKKAVEEIIRNNTDVLVEEDIMSLLKKPPLDSMDTIKIKFLDLAKRQKIVLDTNALDKVINNYRLANIKMIDELKEYRNKELLAKIKDKEIIKLANKDLLSINKSIEKITSKHIEANLDSNIIKKINSVFTKDTEEAKKEKVITDITKYLNGIYKKQLKDNIDIKIMVKDTTLINGIKEQASRYLYTIENSHLFDDMK
jgi:hypothetical protein